MLEALDRTLEAYLRAVVPLPAATADVSFEAPDRDWAARISRPTVNVYLRDVRRNTSQRETGEELVRPADGAPAFRRSVAPLVDCRYLLTAWATDVADQHSLLGGLLAALLRSPRLDPEHLRGGLVDLRPLPTLTLRPGGSGEDPDFWSALGGQLKPGLDVVVTVAVDAAVSVPSGPPVLEYRLRVGDEESVVVA